MSENEKTIRLGDSLPARDGKAPQAAPPGPRGRVVARDGSTGEALFERDNIIVLRGRVFALEKMFEDAVPPGTSQGGYAYARNLSRTVCLFCVGSGGAPASDPFSPYAPAFSDVAMTTPEPFRVVDPADPAGFPPLTAAEQLVYYSPVTDGAGVTRYYSKRFEELDPEWVVDTSGNEAYKKLVLRVGELDCRGRTVSELGLQVAAYDAASNEMSDVELLSRLTFPTESLADPAKVIVVEYYVYA